MIAAVLEGLNLLVTTPLALAAPAGVAWGILGGALPGISPSISMALLLPFTYGMETHLGDRLTRIDVYRSGIRRLDTRDFDQYAGHQRRGCYAARWLSDEAAGPGRRGPGYFSLLRCPREFFRIVDVSPVDEAAGEPRSPVHPRCRILLWASSV